MSRAPIETLQQSSLARPSPASLEVLFTCLAAAAAIPAMGKGGPAEGQLLVPEILLKKSPI